MNLFTEFDITKIVDALNRRRGIVIAVALVSFSLSAYLASQLPNVYSSSTLILISPQRIPQNFISSMVTTPVRDRINAITQEVLSRNRLEKIVNEFGLYSPGGPGTTMEDRVERFRKDIKLDSRRNSTLQISFVSGKPDLAMKVSNRLASLFIEENLQIREQAAVGTTTFIGSETERLRKELDEQEAVINRYKSEHLFELPDQIDTNLRTMEQLRGELHNNMTRLASLQERKTNLEKQVIEAESMAPELATAQTGAGEQVSSRSAQIQLRKKELDALLIRYSEKHPDVLRLKQDIRALESEAAKGAGAAAQASGGAEVGSASGGIRGVLLKQIADIDKETAALRATTQELNRKIATYQARVDNAPLRGIELSKISRTHEITLAKYQDLLRKGLESQISQNMEKKEKGEQFQIIEPANFPQSPVRPNRPLILLIGLVGGLVGGGGLAFAREALDNSFKRGEEIDGYANIPLLAAIPKMVTRGSILEQRRLQMLLVVSFFSALGIGVIAIRLFGQRFF